MGSEQWYCLREGQAQGPFTAQQLRGMADSGQLRPDDQLRRGDQAQWVSAGKVKGLFDSSSGSSSRLKRAKPLAPSTPPPVPPPSPGASTGAIPVVQAVPTMPPSPPVPVGTVVPPMGTAVAVNPVTAAPSGPAAAQADEEDEEGRGSKRRSPLVWCGGLLAVAVVLLLVGLVLFWRPDASPPVAANDANNDSEPEEVVDPATLETDPGAAKKAASASAAGSQASSPESEASEDAVAAAKLETRAAQAIQETKKWSVAAPTRYLVLRGLARVQVGEAWFEPSGEDSETQKLFVVARLINTSSDKPIGFSNWAGTGTLGEESQAVLLDSQRKPLGLAAADARFPAPGSSVSPGATIEDVLMFEVPADPSGDFHLALPRAAVGTSGFFGFQVPLSMAKLGTPPGAQVAEGEVAAPAASTTPAAAVSPAGGERKMEGDIPVIVVKKKDTDGTRPPSLDEINRQIKSFNEGSKPDAAGPNEKPATPQNP